MEDLFQNNYTILFIVALFYASIAGITFTQNLRMALIYALSLLVLLFGEIDALAIMAGATIIAFLSLEVFSVDKKLIKFFPVRYKVIDFGFKYIIEYYYWLFLISFAFLYIGKSANEVLFKLSSYIIGILLMAVLLLFVSRAKFSTCTVDEMITKLTDKCNINNCDNLSRNIKKYEILSYLEDRSFFERGERTHIIPIEKVEENLRRRITIKNFRHPIINLKKLIRRGYGTIEMQLIRTIGVEFGSYNCRIRRKVFEVIYSNLIFNSYINLLGKKSDARANVENWIIQNYIENVSVRFGANKTYYPSEKNTIKQIFGRSIENITEEEFFVWCLGLPYYTNGVGWNAVCLHQDTIERFDLREDLIRDALEQYINETR